ncbi:hypothetical protein FN846DRAFT_785226 [Sphaerosporella brunnea]|uniref:Uncharacterized protein n=1 Tax=Sphaerosporella brunnea TaxID=1250544 RepID=A0A5J5EJF1_9PEZI|nr:hypothetical protein FN846DRAFT_785226 [Sphaerosporella brunnea]
MAIPACCHHSFQIIKSGTTLLRWNCSMCGFGPHWFIYECTRCTLKACRPCAQKTDSCGRMRQKLTAV